MVEPLEKLPEERLGDFLVRCREVRGFSREELSEKTHVAVSYLEWMETGNWKNFTVEAYLRSYLNSVSICLGLDPKKVLDFYSKESGSSYAKEFAPATLEGESLTTSEKKKSKTGTIIIFIILLLILGALFYVVNFSKPETSAETLPEPPTAEEVIPEDTSVAETPIPEGAEPVLNDSILAEDSLSDAKVRETIDSIAKAKELPASATLFISSGSTAEKDSAKIETKEESKKQNLKKSSIEFMASGNEASWIGIKKQADGDTFAKQGNLSVAGTRFTYSGSDTLYVIVGNPVAVAFMTLDGVKTPLPTGVAGRSLKFRVVEGQILKGF